VAGSAVYPVRVRLVALDPTGSVVAAVDSTVAVALETPVPANRRLFGRVAIPLRPGRIIAHAAVQYGNGAGSSFELDTLLVPAPGGDALALGDLLIGAPRARLRIPVGGAGETGFTPGGTLSRADGVEVGIELFGLGPGGRADLELLVAPLDTLAPGSPPRWRLFPAPGAAVPITRPNDSGPIVSWTARFPLRGLRPGAWQLAVRVRDAEGREAWREGRVVVTTP
jgi:hypothetical protein